MATKKAKKVQYLGTGRRKTAIARVRLVPGEGNIVINKRSLEEYFPLDTMKLIVNQPLVATSTSDKFDVFVNVQWKRACIFIKYQNAGVGWPLLHPDYFSADRYIVTQNGMDGLKFGVFWPFYTQPRNRSASSSSGRDAQSGSRPAGGGSRSNLRSSSR